MSAPKVTYRLIRSIICKCIVSLVRRTGKSFAFHNQQVTFLVTRLRFKACPFPGHARCGESWGTLTWKWKLYATWKIITGPGGGSDFPTATNDTFDMYENNERFRHCWAWVCGLAQQILSRDIVCQSLNEKPLPGLKHTQRSPISPEGGDYFPLPRHLTQPKTNHHGEEVQAWPSSQTGHFYQPWSVETPPRCRRSERNHSEISLDYFICHYYIITLFFLRRIIDKISLLITC